MEQQDMTKTLDEYAGEWQGNAEADAVHYRGRSCYQLL
jgi:hypothetical protein